MGGISSATTRGRDGKRLHTGNGRLKLFLCFTCVLQVEFILDCRGAVVGLTGAELKVKSSISDPGAFQITQSARIASPPLYGSNLNSISSIDGKYTA